MDAIVRRTQLTYDRIAADFAAIYAAMPPNLAALADRLAQYIGPQGIIADIGCGHGRDTAWLERTNRLVIGFDLSFQMLLQAKTITRGNLVQMDMQHPAVPSASFDGIWCCASLLHLPKLQAATTLFEFRRIIRAKGMLILSIQEGDSEGWSWSERDRVERYFARYQIPEMSSLLSRAGYAIHEQSTSPGISARWLAFVCVAV
jgi:ubiquinone/menaquinone biosynthesis C-methylase UbiE